MKNWQNCDFLLIFVTKAVSSKYYITYLQNETVSKWITRRSSLPRGVLKKGVLKISQNSQEMSTKKKKKKMMRWTTWGVSVKLSGNVGLNIKSHEKTGLHPLSRKSWKKLQLLSKFEVTENFPRILNFRSWV